MRREKQGRGGCQTLPESGGKPQRMPGRRVVAASSVATSWCLVQGEGPSGEGRK